MTKSSDAPGTGHNLGPHVVGIRVVVRRFVRGETGPSGGPAFTDLLGTCTRWGPEAVEVRAEDGTVTEIPIADIVSGKPVPPRPSRFRRLTDAEVDARCDALRAAPVAGGPVEVHLVGIARLVRALAGSGDAAQVSEPTPGTVLLEGGAGVRHDDSWALLTGLGHGDADVRSALAALADALAERGVSVLAVETAEDAGLDALLPELGFELHHTRAG